MHLSSPMLWPLVHQQGGQGEEAQQDLAGGISQNPNNNNFDGLFPASPDPLSCSMSSGTTSGSIATTAASAGPAGAAAAAAAVSAVSAAAATSFYPGSSCVSDDGELHPVPKPIPFSLLLKYYSSNSS